MTTSGEQKQTKKQTSRQSRTRSANGLTSTEICQILEAAHKSGVKHFAYGELEFVLGGDVALTPASMLYKVENSEELYDNSTEEDAPEEKQPEVDIEELALSDPLGYENIMHGGE